jgi:hypothetical protein
MSYNVRAEERGALDPWLDDSSPNLGPCCVCGGTERVRNIISLHQLSPTPGKGWGCVQCGVPADGAIAVTCDSCGPNSLGDKLPELKFACAGYPGTDGRVPIDSLQGVFDHDYSKHPEVSNADH